MSFGESSPLLDEKRSVKNRRTISRWITTSVIATITLITLVIYQIHNNKNNGAYSSSSETYNPLPIFRTPTHQVNNPKFFQLKHIYHHNTVKDPSRHGRLDITQDFIEKHRLQLYKHTEWSQEESPWSIKLPFRSNEIKMKRLSNRTPDFMESYLEFARVHGTDAVAKIHLDWDDENVMSPNVTDKETVITLALMSSNAYVEIPETGDWRDVNFNQSFGHGWDGSGVRGHIFVSDDNSTVVIAYKGTSAAYLSGSGNDDTVVEDKENDNLLFSCCCARVGYMWTTVCDCYQGSYTCDQKCLEKELYRKDKYYHAAMNVYRNVSALYPDANIWVTGHSLGGALSSLIGRTYGLPAVSFEAPGEQLATKRLHLPMPPGLPGYMEGIWHFGHTADPIFMGVCNGASSTCSVAGYAMETQCHTGKQCVYDVVGDKGWHVNLLNHRIHTVIDDVISAYNDTAPCIEVPPCRDCFSWNFIAGEDKDYKDKEPKTRSSSSDGIASSSTLSVEPTKSPECKKKTWYGRCLEYEWAINQLPDQI